jgi:hypothetical protein
MFQPVSGTKESRKRLAVRDGSIDCWDEFYSFRYEWWRIVFYCGVCGGCLSWDKVTACADDYLNLNSERPTVWELE